MQGRSFGATTISIDTRYAQKSKQRKEGGIKKDKKRKKDVDNKGEIVYYMEVGSAKESKRTLKTEQKKHVKKKRKEEKKSQEGQKLF